jgi:hypothetical protein
VVTHIREKVMTTDEIDLMALKAWASDQVKPDQATTKRLYVRGLIEVSRVTNFESTEEELLPTFITERGRKFMDRQ